MPRLLKVAAAGVAGFVVSFGLIVLYWASGRDESECIRDECTLEYAAVMTWSIVAGALVGTVCAFVTYALTRRRGTRG